jgi:hypothetical protein
MQYVTRFPQSNSGCILSGIHSWPRAVARFFSVMTFAIALSACNAGGGGPLSTSDNTDPSKLPPGSLSYSLNPAYYPYGSAISPNALHSSGTITSLSISPALPTGLSFNASNGTISGTPTTMTAAQAYTVTASNPQGTSYLTLNLAVTDQPPTMSYGTLTQVFTVGNAVSITPTLGGGPTTSCNSTPALPAGMTLSSQCVLGGTVTTPTAAANYTISANNSGGSASLVFNITVKDLAPTISYSPTTYTFYRTQAISTVTPTNTGGTVTSCASSPALPTGVNLSSTCAISGTPSALSGAQSYTITATNSGGTSAQTLTIGVQEPAPNIIYIPAYRALTINQAATIHVTNSAGVPTTCTSSALLPTGLSIASNCDITGTPTALTSGWTSTITATNPNGSSATSLSIDVNDVAPVISYSNSPFVFNTGTTITSQTPVNTGGTITGCSPSPALPAGLSLSNTCVLSGTPTGNQAATNYTITASNSGGSRATVISIAVQTLPPNLSYAGNPFTLKKGTAIATGNVTNSGGPVSSCSSSPTLPAGLTLSSSCNISGTPTAVTAAANYTVTGTNAGGSNSVIISVTVNDVLPNFSYTGSPFTYTKGTVITTLTPTNTGGTIISCSSSPTLPAGLSLSNTCVISGTPSVPVTTTNYTISATNTGGTATTSINVTVNDIAPVISYAGSPFNFTTGSSIGTLTPTNTGGAPTSCTVSPALPTGLSLSSTCVLTGTPTTPSSAANYTITATNSGGTSNATINITVTSLAPILSYNGSPFTYTNGTAITPLNPVNTGGAINSCSPNIALPTGLSLSSSCVLSGTPTAVFAAANYTITATNANGSSSATISITVNDVAPSIDYIPSSYSFTYTKGSLISPLTPNNHGGAITNCTATPSLPAGLSISTSDCKISGTPSGIQVGTSYSITASNSGGSSSATITIAVNDNPPTISYSGGPFAYTVNAAISTLTPTTSGGAITSCTSSPGLPGGLSLSSTCVITGTPNTVTAAANYTITASNSGGSASTTISVQIKDIAPTLSYTGSPFTYTQGVTITTLNPTDTGGAITGCSSSPSLPSGLSLSSTCVISGAPTPTSSATNYTITATNSGGSASATISITVNPGPPVLSYTGSPFTFTNGTAISTINPVNNGGTISSCSSSPGLPAGLALSPTCVITGTPTAVSSATNYVITGTNAQGSSSYTINITVNDTPPSIGYTPSSYVEVLRTAISTITPSNSGGSILSCSSNPALPAGLSLSSTCTISGTPTAVSAAANYTITATNSGGATSAIVNIQVKNLPQIVFYSLMPLNGSTNGTPTGSNNIWTITLDGIDKVALTQNTSTGLDSQYPAFSADGSKITYGSKRALNGSTNGTATNSFNIWNMLSNGTSPSHLTSNTIAGLNTDDPPRFSPDGTKIVFASKMALNGSANGTATGSYNIWVVNSDGTGLTHLTANTNASLDSIQPVFGTSNSVVYFSSMTAQNGTDNGTATASYNVWKVNTDGTGRMPLTSYGLSSWDCQDINVSPDGTTLVYASLANIGGSTARSYNIWTMGTNGTSNNYLTNRTGLGQDNRYPRFSPDGTEIVFSSKMRIAGVSTSSYNIWKMAAAGTSQNYLTTDTGSGNDSIYPIFSPDNSMIAFTSRLNIGGTSASSYNIWVMKSDGTSQNYLTSNTNSGLDSQMGPGRAWFAP